MKIPSEIQKSGKTNGNMGANNFQMLNDKITDII